MRKSKTLRKRSLKDDYHDLYNLFFTKGVWMALSHAFRNPPVVAAEGSDEYREIQEAYWVCECHHPEFDPNEQNWFIKKENRDDVKVQKS